MSNLGGSNRGPTNVSEPRNSSPRIPNSVNEGQPDSQEEKLLNKVHDIVHNALEEFRKEDKSKGKEKVMSEVTFRKPVSFKAFKANGATEFTGLADPTEALIWVENTEKVFRIAHVAKEDESVYAAALFTRKALTWWNNTYKTLNEEERDRMPWEMFKARFLEQYCPKDLKRRLEKEFLEIKQGDMTVSEYETIFNQKVQFASKHVQTDEEKAERFVDGLRYEIKDFVSVREIPSFSKAVEYARQREYDLLNRKELSLEPERESEDRILATMTCGQSRSVRPKRSQSRHMSRAMMQDVTTRSNTLPNCQGCGKAHEGLCVAKMKCYRCGEMGHYRSTCPKRDHACFTCGDGGHRYFECPYKGQDGNRAPMRPTKKVCTSIQKEEVPSKRK